MISHKRRCKVLNPLIGGGEGWSWPKYTAGQTISGQKMCLHHGAFSWRLALNSHLVNSAQYGENSKHNSEHLALWVWVLLFIESSGKTSRSAPRGFRDCGSLHPPPHTHTLLGGLLPWSANLVNAHLIGRRRGKPSSSLFRKFRDQVILNNWAHDAIKNSLPFLHCSTI